MINKEKILEGLRSCASMDGNACMKCPYSDECCELDLPYVGIPHLASDVLVLLKEYEKEVEHLKDVISRLYIIDYKK